MGSLPPAPTSPLVVQATALRQSARAPAAPLSPVLPRSGVLHSAFTRRATTPAPGPVTDATPTRPLVAQPPVIQPPVAQAPAAEPAAPAPVAAPAPPDRVLAATSPAVGAPAKHGDAKHGGGSQDDQHHTGSDSPPAVLASVTPDAAPTAGDDSEDGHPQRGDHDDGG